MWKFWRNGIYTEYKYYKNNNLELYLKLDFQRYRFSREEKILILKNEEIIKYIIT